MSKARNLSDFISDATIDVTEIADGAVTAAKLHSSLDLSSKTVTFADDHISGNKIHGGVISGFASTGIDDNASSTLITLNSDNSGDISGNWAVTNGQFVINRDAATPFKVSRDTDDGDLMLLRRDDTNIAKIRVFSAGRLAFTPGGSNTEILSIDTTNNRVGIGDAVFGKGNGYAGNTSAAANGTLDLYNYLTGTTELKNSGAYPIVLSTNNTERMRITSGGYVSIGGDATPQSQLEVKKAGTGTTEADKRIAGFYRKDLNTAGHEGYIHLGNYDGHYGVKLGFNLENSTPGYQNHGFYLSTVYNNENITNHVKRLVVKANGNVGIGTDSPTYKLTVDSNISSSSTGVIGILQATNGADKTAGDIGISVGNGGESTNASDVWFRSSYNGSLTEHMRITSAGHILLGRTNNVTAGGTYGARLQILGDNTNSRSDNTIAITTLNNEVAGRFHLQSTGANAISLDADPGDLRDNSYTSMSVDGNEYLRLAADVGAGSSMLGQANAALWGKAIVGGLYATGYDGSGVAIAKTGDMNHSILFRRGWRGSDNSGSTVENTIEYREYGSHTFWTGGGVDSMGKRMTIDSSGNIGAPSGSNIYSASDVRLKRNINSLTGALDKVNSLRGVSFEWREDYLEDEPGELYGFIAQEVQEVDTNLISSFGGGTVKIGDPEDPTEIIEDSLTVNDKFVVPLLVEAIKELTNKIEAIEARLDAAGL